MEKPIGQITPDELLRLKNTHGRVYEVTATDDGVTHVAYFRRPDMQTLAAMTKVAKTDEIRASQVLLENCFLAGSDAVKTDTSLFLAAVSQLSKVIGAVRASIKNV